MESLQTIKRERTKGKGGHEKAKEGKAVIVSIAVSFAQASEYQSLREQATTLYQHPSHRGKQWRVQEMRQSPGKQKFVCYKDLLIFILCI